MKTGTPRAPLRAAKGRQGSAQARRACLLHAAAACSPRLCPMLRALPPPAPKTMPPCACAALPAWRCSIAPCSMSRALFCLSGEAPAAPSALAHTSPALSSHHPGLPGRRCAGATSAGFLIYDIFLLPTRSTAGLRPLAGSAPARSLVIPGRRSGRQQISAPPASYS